MVEQHRHRCVHLAFRSFLVLGLARLLTIFHQQLTVSGVRSMLNHAFIAMKLSTTLFSLMGLALLTPQVHADEWPSWRGPNDNNTLAETNFPITWDAKTNVRWRTPLPEMGNSSAIVWGNVVFLTQAEEAAGKRSLICFDRVTGKPLWTQSTVFKQEEPKHNTNTYCASTPVTDGKHVYAYHASAGIFCYDLEGKEIWKRDLGPQIHTFGGGSSPVLYGEHLYVYHGPGKDARLVAMIKTTGEIVWEFREPAAKATAKREDGFKGSDEGRIASYSTPTVVKHGEREELIMCFPELVISLDPSKGKELWRCGGLNPLVYTSPIIHEGNVIAMGGYQGPAISVKLGGKGDVTDTHRLWKTGMGSARLSTGVINDNKLFLINMTGIGECLDLKTGEQVSKARIRQGKHGKPVWGACVLVGDKIYAVDKEGVTFVMKADPTFEIIAANPLGEASNCTPAFSNGEIFIRTENALWCIAMAKDA